MTITPRPALLAALLASLSVVACGGGKGQSPAPAAPATSPAPATTATTTAAVPWAQQDHKQRLDTMGLVVFPRMKKAFQAHDSDEFGGFRCQTCHGDNFDSPEINFRMPNPELPPLAADDPYGAAMSYDPDTATFMAKQVLPAMIEMLGEKPYDPATGEGLRCFSCHPQATPK
jgi:hypothetical protein